ncbi:MAG TPA: metal ABC transporter permease [Candidatus Sulfomarinibacteraceae bacterium]|nr:metal ABC transporter permease [Candidatus Sulfomarinibacteraceae bacterium]
MTITQLEIQLIAAVAAVACALPGVFLVLRQMAMMSDAISHTVLLGIVIGFFLVGDINSPLLIVGAALMGVITVSLVELLNRTRLVKEDAAIGLVFPALFSVAVILISRYAGDVHLDEDAVLLGELAFAPFERFELAGLDLGPVALYVMGAILVLNLLFITVFYKELKLATFDPGLAAALGFSPGLIHYGLMATVSVTAVGAFDTVGSILVVALMVAPPVSAYLLTDRLPKMLGLSVVFAVGGAISGYWLAHWLDANIAGSMATMFGVIFGLVFLLAPERGLVALARRRARQKWEFAQAALAMHLLNHEGTPQAAEENRLSHLSHHLRWDPQFAREVVRRAQRRGLIERHNGHLTLTDAGRTLARATLV